MKLEERGKTVRLGAVAATVAVALTGAVGCKGTDNGSEGKPKVALVVINQQAVFFKELIRGAKKAAKDQGVDLTVFNANNDSAAQNTAIENYQQQNFDSIIVNPIDVEGIKPAISNASKAGSSIIAVDAIVDDPSVDTQVGIDNRKAGEQMGRYFTAFNKRAGRTGTSVGEVSALNSFVQVQRQKGFEQVVKKGGYKIAQVVDGKNVQEDALQASEDLITSQGSRMRSVYSTGEPALRRGQQVLDIVESEGMRGADVILCHLNPSHDDWAYQRDLAERGAWLEFDMLGMDYLYPGEGQSPSDAQAVDAIRRLVTAGHGGQLLLSSDVFLKIMLLRYGGFGYAHTLRSVVPRMRRAGLDDAQIDTMLVENPRLLFERAAGAADRG